MTQPADEAAVEFADDNDAPIGYMQRTRGWYLGLGYDNPYRWAHYTDAPFQPLAKPLAESGVALITTAAPPSLSSEQSSSRSGSEIMRDAW